MAKIYGYCRFIHLIAYLYISLKNYVYELLIKYERYNLIILKFIAHSTVLISKSQTYNYIIINIFLSYRKFIH